MNEIKVGSKVKVEKEMEVCGWGAKEGEIRLQIMEFSGVVTAINGKILVVENENCTTQVHIKNAVLFDKEKKDLTKTKE